MRLIIACCLLVLAPRLALADGIMWEAPSAQDLIGEKAQQAWVEWKDGRERLIIAVSPQSVSPHLAWVLPIPAPAHKARLTLIDKLPQWPGDEVRTKANLASHPVMLGLYFFLMLLVSAGGTSAGIVLLILFLLSAISIGPGPSLPSLSDMAVQTSGRVELGGLVSELADAPSVEAFERYLKAKSTALPAPARGIIDEYIREGSSFVVSWAKQSEIANSLAVEIEFPAPKAWYPVRLTSVYAKAKTPIDLHVAGWQDTDPGVSAQALVGYYQGTGDPRAHTRILFQGRAAALAQDWTFAPRARTLDLRLARMTGEHPFLANAFLLLLCSLAGGFVLGWLAFPNLRNSRGLIPLAKLGASGVLPFVGPYFALRRLFPEAVAPQATPEPKSQASVIPQAHNPRYRWGSAAVVVGVCGQFLGFLSETPWAIIVGGIACAGGLSAFWIFRGHPKTASILTACLLSIGIPVLGPVVGLFGRPGLTSAPKPASPSESLPVRWKLFAYGLAAACFSLHLWAGSKVLELWPLDRATASIEYSSHGFKTLIRKSNEGATKVNLGAIRSALSVYYADTNALYPASLEALTVGGKYLQAVPLAKIGAYHQDSNKVLLLTGEQYAKEELDDSGGWAYVLSGPSSGTVLVNCTHTDTKGSAWRSY